MFAMAALMVAGAIAHPIRHPAQNSRYKIKAQ